MKRRMALACSFALILSLAGCGQTKEASVEQILNEELSGEITVSCYDTLISKDFLEKAAKSFEEKNPGTKINVEAFGKMPEIKTSEGSNCKIAIATKEDDSQERTNYINKINTELMSGGGADVLSMDILPYYKYADSGLLEDMNAYMDADSSFDIGNYRENIIRAMEYHGGQYLLPLDYIFHYIAYDSSLFSDEEKIRLESGKAKITYEEIFDIAKDAFERKNANSAERVSMIGAFTNYMMLDEMMAPGYETYIDMENRQVNLMDGRFAALLESVRNYGELGYLQQSLELNHLDMNDIKKQREDQFFYKTKNQLSLTSEVLREAGLNNGKLNFGFGSAVGGDDSNDKALGPLTDGNKNAPFDYLQAYGINANSSNKALAWAFVKYLMSEEIQSDPQLMLVGLPINNAARIEQAETTITRSFLEESPGEGSVEDGELTETEKRTIDRYIEVVENFSDSLNYHPVQDDTVNNMIRSEVSHFFDGSKSAAEVAGVLQEKIELYLNE